MTPEQERLIAAAKVVGVGDDWSITTDGVYASERCVLVRFGCLYGTPTVRDAHDAEGFREAADLLDLAALLRGEMPEPPGGWEDCSDKTAAALSSGLYNERSSYWMLNAAGPVSAIWDHEEADELGPHCLTWLRLKRWQLILQREGLL